MDSYKEMKNILEKIPEEKSIIIAGHENSDMDSIGASLAMAYFLENLGKKDITVLIEKKDMYKIKWFKNMKFIENEINKYYISEINTEKIGEMVMDKLKDVDEVAYVRFASVYRQFKDINTFVTELKNILMEREG